MKSIVKVIVHSFNTFTKYVEANIRGFLRDRNGRYDVARLQRHPMRTLFVSLVKL